MISFFNFIPLLSILFSVLPPPILADSKRKDFPAIVSIQVEKNKHIYTGTAFSIDSGKKDSDRLVTTFYMISNVEDIKEISIQDSSGKWHPVKAILALDAINDLAVLKVKDYKFKEYYFVDHPIDSINDVEIASFQDGKPTYSHGKALPKNWKDGEQHFIFHRPLRFGTLGSPIFKDNNLIAILREGIYVVKNMEVATPVEPLRQLLSKPFLKSSPKVSIKNEKQRLQQLAEEGDPKALYRLAQTHFNYHLRLYRLAREGDIHAIFALAPMRRGLETEQSLAEALKLFTEAAEKGHVEAQLRLALLYDVYRPIVNQQSAFKWYQEAGKHGNTLAKYKLALFHYNGRGRKKNPEKALELFTEAAEKGLPEAKSFIKKIRSRQNLKNFFNSCRSLFQPQAS